MGKVTFSDVWLDHEEYKEWIRRDSDKYKAYCTICRKCIELGKMGERALSSHQKSKKHCMLVKAKKPAVPISQFFSSREQETRQDSHPSTQTPSTSRPSAVSVAVTSDVLKAEILWTIKSVSSHYSYKSCEGSSELFTAMFPDSDIAARFKCGERKTAYLATYGIGPHFTSQLKQKVKKETAYVLLFDESLNREMQEKQLDIHVRFWDNELVTTCYLTSEFLGHASANDLYDQLEPIVCEFGHRKLLQLSMDGPNVNWKLYRSIEDEIEKQTTRKMLQTGSCGLHIVHNAFRSGCEASGWDVEGLLSSLYHLFNDAPARQEDFLDITGNNTLPLKFCKHRWVENIKAAERALALLPHIVEYCTAAKGKKVTCPTCHSFTVVQKAIQDPLITAKLHFFLMVAKEIEPFLRMYQTDRPMLPFIGQDLGLLIKSLLEKFIKPEVMGERSKSMAALVKIDTTNKSDWRDTSQVAVGFSAERQLLRSNKSSDRQKFEFRSSCRDFLIAVTKKLLMTAPIIYPLVRCLSCLDPRELAAVEKKAQNMKKLSKILNIMVEARRVEESVCDRVLGQFSAFIELLQTNEGLRSKFTEFCPSDEVCRVDTLLHSCLAGADKTTELWGVVSHLLLLSHGQATVERSFSFNKEVSCENLAGNSLIARRHIVQEVRRCGGVANIPVTKELLLSASSARAKYQRYLEDQKKEEASKKQGQKRKLQEEKVTCLKAKRARIEEDISSLIKQADKLCDEAEEKSTLTLLCQANALRAKAKEKKALLPPLDQEIETEQQNLKDGL